MNLLLFHLAIADLLVTFLMMPTEVYNITSHKYVKTRVFNFLQIVFYRILKGWNFVGNEHLLLLN